MREFKDWYDAHHHAAHSEGWCIFDCKGSSNGRWQVQKIDDPKEGMAELESDEWAFAILAHGYREGRPHAVAAMEFLRKHNPKEAEMIQEYLDA